MQSATLTIRPYQPHDEAAVVQLWHTCELTRPWNDPYKDIARKLTVQPELFLVGEVNGVVVGVVMGGFDGHRGWVNYLAVAPEHQRQGHATTLMSAVEQRLVALGCPKVNLQVRASNTAVLGFYQSLAFAQDDVVSFGKRLIPDLA